MPDYGHTLEFGTFLTPGNDPASTPVALADLSERLGYDLATFQDHPYQPRFLDAWTLLSYVAARTERIHLAGNVLNLPLRQPAVLARSVASLDLLSGGRIELALGAGGFWDPIAAMGGPRLEPGQAVQALDEALQIIRGIWDADERRPLNVAGQFHSVHGAKRGPAPAHSVQVWLGALKPRMQRLIGRSADGWLPSLTYLKPGDLARGNAVIDRAASAAGRDPREIRRLLNVSGSFGPTVTGRLQGPPAHWVEELTGLAVEDGVSTFIVASDDPTMLQTFAEEVLPAVRAAVGAARGEVAPAPRQRSTRGAGEASRPDRLRRAPGGARRACCRTGGRRLRQGPLDLHARWVAGSGAPGRVRGRGGRGAGFRPRAARATRNAQRWARHQRTVHERRRHRRRPRPDEHRSRCSTRRPGGSGSAPVRGGRTSPPYSPRTAGRSAPATTAAWGSAAWPRQAGSAGWSASTA